MLKHREIFKVQVVFYEPKMRPVLWGGGWLFTKWPEFGLSV